MSRPPRFPDVEWYCDHCGAHLSSQAGFDDHKYVWKCSNCGGKNSISRDNIRQTNYAAINGTLQLLEVLRTICMHCGLMALIMLLFGTAFDDLPKYLTFPAIAYPVLLVVMLLVIIAGHFRNVGVLGTLFDSIVGDIIRPYREPLRTGRILHDIRVHIKKRIVIWSFIKLLVYIAIIVAEILLFIHFCTITWGSVGEAANAWGDWLNKIENLRELYIPFIVFVGSMIIITFFAFGIDKFYAIKQKWRVKEPTLFTLSILFGAIGAVAGMFAFRHKINKPGFKILLPILAVVQIGIIVWVSIRYFA